MQNAKVHAKHRMQKTTARSGWMPAEAHRA
jgi:hypothetical protein